MQPSERPEHSRSPGRVNYIPQLDGLRAFAVGAVLLLHFHPHPGVLLSMLGHQGVRLFFVLSGFLITRILLTSRARIVEHAGTVTEALRTFYIRRALRIFPAYYATLIVLILAGAPNTLTYVHWHATYTTNFLIAHLQRWPIPTGHFWTLAVEEQFYLVWPLIVLTGSQRNLIRPACVAIAVGACFHFLASMFHFKSTSMTLTPAALDALGIGALLATAGRRKAVKWFLATGTLVTIIGLPLIRFLTNNLDHVESVLLETGLSCGYAAVIRLIADGPAGWLSRLLCFRPLTAVGKISYGVYLYHIPVAWLAEPIVNRGASFAGTASPVYFVTANTGLVLVVASMAWVLFERPILNLKERFLFGSTSISDQTTPASP